MSKFGLEPGLLVVLRYAEEWEGKKIPTKTVRTWCVYASQSYGQYKARTYWEAISARICDDSFFWMPYSKNTRKDKLIKAINKFIWIEDNPELAWAMNDVL